MKHYAVIGRIEFQDEDTAFTCEAANPGSAELQFHDWMRDGGNASHRIYITNTLQSDTPITVLP